VVELVEARVEDRSRQRRAASQQSSRARVEVILLNDQCVGECRETSILTSLVRDRAVGRARNVAREDQYDQRHDQRNREKQRMSAALRACTGHEPRT